MDEKFKKLLAEFKKLNLPDGQYAIYGSGPMAVRGIKPTDNLDVVVKGDLYQKLREEHTEKEKIVKGKELKYIEIGDIEVWHVKKSLIDNAEAVINRAELIDDIRFILLEDLIAWKTKMARPKDFEHIRMIKDYLEKRNQDK